MYKLSLPFDTIGMFAGILCTIHCLATPLLFIAKACSTTCCGDAPVWWIMIDYLFLFISFTAIYFISKSLNIKWLKISFWISWIILFFTILDHSVGIFILPQNFIYLPSALIILLHFYNLKFCKCKTETCCLETK
ncbi:MAG: hypothetical protein CMD02_05405 [Flavobacteriales bacterium]|nr:hypothetical protein [Flavobacteriales bacterium]|tara:strand:+ start:11259 stop:11663 length:405 start_codon:yes stop_codon:yes gene_type:complete